MKNILRASAFAVFIGYVMNNAHRLPDFVWWMFPEHVWAHVNYYLVFPLACLISIGVPTFLGLHLAERLANLITKSVKQ